MKSTTRYKFKYRNGTVNKDGKVRGPRESAEWLPNDRYSRYNEIGLIDKITGKVRRKWAQGRIPGEKLAERTE